MFKAPNYIKTFADYSEKMAEIKEILPDLLVKEHQKNPLVRALTVCGDPGCGKTYTITQFINSIKDKYKIELGGSDTSVVQLHEKLYRAHNGLVFLDECDNIFKNAKSMLKVAADSSAERIVTYDKMLGVLVDCSSIGYNPTECAKFIKSRAEDRILGGADIDTAEASNYPPKTIEQYYNAVEKWRPKNFIFSGSLILASNLTKHKINEYIGSDALATRGRMFEFKIANYDAWIDIITNNCKDIKEFAGNTLSKESVEKALKWLESEKLKSLFTENHATISMRYFGDCASHYEDGCDDDYMVRHFSNMVQQSVRK